MSQPTDDELLAAIDAGMRVEEEEAVPACEARWIGEQAPGTTAGEGA